MTNNSNDRCIIKEGTSGEGDGNLVNSQTEITSENSCSRHSDNKAEEVTRNNSANDAEDELTGSESQSNSKKRKRRHSLAHRNRTRGNESRKISESSSNSSSDLSRSKNSVNRPKRMKRRKPKMNITENGKATTSRLSTSGSITNSIKKNHRGSKFRFFNTKKK